MSGLGVSTTSSAPRALVLGGTAFIGVHLVVALVAADWQVTLFNRGRTSPEAFGSLEQLRGDRDGDVSALAGREWDVVFDLTGYHPSQIDRVAEHLAGRCGHYVFVSSVSAYASAAHPGTTEDAPLATLDGPMPDEVDAASYGPLKALCEARVTDLFESRTIVRPTIVVGPLDPTDRFTYWVQRLSEPGPHLVPPDLDAQVQHIDARDLAAWMVHLGAAREAGTFNAAAQPTAFGRLTQAVADAAGTPSDLLQLTVEELEAAEVRPWLDLPLWLPPSEQELAGFFQVDSSRAAAAGLRTRPLEDTVRDTLAWVDERGRPELTTGLSREREAELIPRHRS